MRAARRCAAHTMAASARTPRAMASRQRARRTQARAPRATAGASSVTACSQKRRRARRRGASLRARALTRLKSDMEAVLRRRRPHRQRSRPTSWTKLAPAPPRRARRGRDCDILADRDENNEEVDTSSVGFFGARRATTRTAPCVYVDERDVAGKDVPPLLFLASARRRAPKSWRRSTRPWRSDARCTSVSAAAARSTNG